MVLKDLDQEQGEESGKILKPFSRVKIELVRKKEKKEIKC